MPICQVFFDIFTLIPDSMVPVFAIQWSINRPISQDFNQTDTCKSSVLFLDHPPNCQSVKFLIRFSAHMKLFKTDILSCENFTILKWDTDDH